ncbi:cytochrome c family protein [Tardibacter chloracetimidivorans]|uniref:Cytochrome c family protein n=2 Tax=Tardibacter chloracetimidivorans TaxID=1921510 RepID=A0A1L3ZZB9_9SPHN|nr:cytochrome c family protein [Tardibacter chloracetimidivorans]
MAVSGAAFAGAGLPRGDAVRGVDLYQAKCGACHSLDSNRVGPAHRGVVGRRAGRVADFRYSKALSASHIVWTPANLDRWLRAPTVMVPGTMMGFRVSSPQERADIIAYLAQNPSRR